MVVWLRREASSNAERIRRAHASRTPHSTGHPGRPSLAIVVPGKTDTRATARPQAFARALRRLPREPPERLGCQRLKEMLRTKPVRAREGVLMWSRSKP